MNLEKDIDKIISLIWHTDEDVELTGGHVFETSLARQLIKEICIKYLESIVPKEKSIVNYKEWKKMTIKQQEIHSAEIKTHNKLISDIKANIKKLKI